MQTRSSLQRRSHSEVSDRLVANIKPRPWGNEQHEQPQANQPQPIRHDFSHVDLFAHDPGPRTIPYGVQARPAVGASNDIYGQEGNSSEVTHRDRGTVSVMGTAPSANPNVQRQAEEDEPETDIQPKLLGDTATSLVQRQAGGDQAETGVHRLPFSLHVPDRPSPPVIPWWGTQAKLTVGQPNDVYEQEADRVAEQVMSMAPPATPTVQRQEEEAAEAIQTKPLAETITPLVQRQESLEEDEPIQAKCDACEQEEPIQRAAEGVPQTQPALERRLSASQGQGSVLPDEVRTFMEPRFGADFSQVRVHTGSEAVQMNRDLNAQAFTHKQDVYFGAGTAPAKDALTAHELTHVVQQAGTTVNSSTPMAIHRKEVQRDSEIQGKQDWTTIDREKNTQRWKDACLTNLNSVDSSQYVKVVERKDFYKWFYEYTTSLGYTTRWALAAYVVANGAHQIADMDVDHAIANDALEMANVELQGAMREGNQVIFDNVLPKLKKLLDGGALKGKAALNWDMQVLAEEQTLIQPMYSRMSKQTIEQLNYIARKKRFAWLGASLSGDDKVPKGPYNNDGTVPEFDQSNIQNIGDRWMYGMNLGNKFTPGGSGFDPDKDKMPAVGTGYQGGSEFAKVDTRANLHKLDAWLNPNRLSRVKGDSGSDIQAIINSLTEFEKLQVLLDRSPDGWSYSIWFAQFDLITEAMVQQALPSVPASAVAAFLSRYRAELKQVQLKYPNPVFLPM